MKTVRFSMHCETGFAGADHEGIGEIEVDDNATQEEIEEEIEAYTKEWAYGLIDIYFKILNP